MRQVILRVLFAFHNASKTTSDDFLKNTRVLHKSVLAIRTQGRSDVLHKTPKKQRVFCLAASANIEVQPK